MTARRFIASGLFMLTCTACKAASPPPSFLAPLDVQTVGGLFAPDTVVDDLSFSDSATIGAATIQAFFAATPYGGESFLSTYASHGLSAASAFAAAAEQEGVNPIALLAFAEAQAGVVYAKTYPSDPSRVEFVFGCGCSGPSVCDDSWEGLDRQALCLAATLRASLDAIASKGATAGGWGPGETQTTLDGFAVTPTDQATAAVYQYDPVEGATSSSGVWLFWNIWNLYTSAMNYFPPVQIPDAGSFPLPDGGFAFDAAIFGDAAPGDGGP